jgi:hypothetical protein
MLIRRAKIYHPYLVGWAEFDVSEGSSTNGHSSDNIDRGPTSWTFWRFCETYLGESLLSFLDNNKMPRLLDLSLPRPLPQYHPFPLG